MSLVEIHGRLANTAMIYFLILALWGLWRALRKQGLDSSYWGALAIAEILIVVQGVLGAILYFGGDRPERWVHILYGVVAALVVPGLYAYTRGESDRRVMLIYGVTLLIAVGIIWRAISTAGGA
jgi:CDP-diglyceride synthetase